MRLIIVLCLAASMFGQVAPRPSLWVGEGEPPIRILGSGYSFQEARYAALYTFGPRLDLNPTATWPDAPVNLLPCSDDMTCAGWTNGSDGVTPTTFSGDGTTAYPQVYKAIATQAGVSYTIYARTRRLSGSTPSPGFLHSSSATGNNTGLALTTETQDFVRTVLGEAGGGNVTFGLAELSGSSATFVWEVTRFAVYPGTYTAEQAAAIYEKTAANRESITDWSGHGATLCNGGNCSTTSTNSASNSVASYNLLAAGSSEDLTNGAWAAAGITADSATLLTFTGAPRQLYQNIPTTDGASYIISADVYGISDLTGCDIRFFHLNSATGNSTSISPTGALSRYSATVLGKTGGGNVAFGIADYSGGACDAKQIYTSDIQVEQVPTGTTTPLPYASAASPVFQCVSCDLTTDDYLSSTVTLSNDWTFHALIRPDDITSVGLWRNGTSNPKISLDANSKVVYTNGTDTVTATNAVTAGLWHIITVVNRGGTIYHYLDGAANGSGDASGASNAFAALQIGYDGSNYFDGAFAAFAADDTGASARTVYGNGSCSSSSTASESRLIRQCGAQGKLAWEAWNNRSICTVGYRALGFCDSAPTELP